MPSRGTCPAQSGDYFEFFAEIDVLCALSTCPGGDLSKFGWGSSDEDMKSTCRPLGVEIYNLKDKTILQGWQAPVSPQYRGAHGLRGPTSGM